jgi:hypothetical protein
MSFIFTSDVSQDIVIVLPCCVSDNIVGCGFIDANVLQFIYYTSLFINLFFLYLNMTDEQIKEIEDRLEQLEKEQANLELDIDTILKRLSCN